MAWVRLDDNFHWHPKVARLSDATYRLYVGALCYCNRYQRGGRIEHVDLVTIYGRGRRGRTLADELVDAGLWTVEDWGWQIHDYLQYQPDPVKQAAGKAGGEASAQARAAAKAKHDAQARAVPVAEDPAQPPSRTRPVPVPLGVENPSVGSPPVDNSVSISSRGWRGEEEHIGAVLQRFQRPEAAS